MLRSPSSNTTTPAPMGSQTRTDRDRRPCILMTAAGLHALEEPTQQHRQADHHPERVRVKVTALHPSQDAAEPTDRRRRAVDQGAIDQRLIAALPESIADEPGQRGDDVLVEP